MQEKETRWQTSLLPFAICLYFFIFLISCDTDKGPDIPVLPPAPSDTTPGDISNKLVARIYFDASVSMQGFVKPNSTRYARLCLQLESVVVSGWQDEDVEFFQFGERVEQIDRNEHLNVVRPQFYENENIHRQTFIEKVIDHGTQLRAESRTPELTEPVVNNTPEEPATSPAEEVKNNTEENPLVVIVTDLFQNRNDITSLVTRLKEQYIQQNLEVGILGLRSEFDGFIYGIAETPQRYRSRPGNPDTFRPFYLLALGKHADISHYFDRLIANGFSEAETIIFSRYLVSPLLSFEGAKIEKLENLIGDTIVAKPDSRLKEYRIRKKDRPSKISAKMRYELLPHAMPFDSNIFEPTITVEHNRSNSDQSKKIRQTAENCLEVTSTFAKNGNGNDELIVDFELDSRVLSRRTVYLYKAALRPKIDTYQVPKWCSGWDMGTGRNGAKTLNLVNFVDGLMDIAVSEHQPKIAQFYFYVEKR